MSSGGNMQCFVKGVARRGYCTHRQNTAAVQKHSDLFWQGTLKDKDRPATAWERGAGLAGFKRIDTESNILSNTGYSEATELMKLGYWEKAYDRFMEVKNQNGMAQDKSVLIALATCCIELGRFDEGKKFVGLCSAVHAGTKGLANLAEECEWGIELLAERNKESEDKERAIREFKEKHGYHHKSHAKSEHDEGTELLNNLPLETKQVTWLKEHLGRSLDDIGLTFDVNTGRAIKAKRSFKAGDTIYSEKSLLFAPEYLVTEYADSSLSLCPDSHIDTPTVAKPRPTKCSHCRSHIKVDRDTCKSCGIVYCSSHCKDEARSMYHRTECQALRADSVKAIRDRLVQGGYEYMWKRYLLMIRITSLSLQSGVGRPWPSALPWFSHMTYREGEHKKANIAKSEGPEEDMRDVKPTMYGLMAMIYTSIFVPVKYGGEWQKLDEQQRMAIGKEVEKEYDLLFDVTKTNCVAQPNLKNLVKREHPDRPILPFLSMANHSCLPNAEVRDSTLIATDDIQPGMEITISYTPNNVPTDLKHHYLKKYHHFHCRCMYCLFKMQDQDIDVKQTVDSISQDNLEKTRKFRAEYNNPDKLMTSGGILTKMGIDLQSVKYDKMLDKYPEEFREHLKLVQERALEGLSNKPVEEVRADISKRKQRLARLSKIGLLDVKEEKIALDVVMDALKDEE
eukprot:TRINITY_DN24524_c0_g1_i1.p1 TRINITY_DN24524_c0_g1~~TRINITY_DN24524_c0_g1_i1.p1  ORF type:complete len:680 (+),score=140.94 TRINITY_DN24524_c0_g1_i1:50-2089(+)